MGGIRKMVAQRAGGKKKEKGKHDVILLNMYFKKKYVYPRLDSNS